MVAILVSSGLAISNNSPPPYRARTFNWWFKGTIRFETVFVHTTAASRRSWTAQIRVIIHSKGKKGHARSSCDVAYLLQVCHDLLVAHVLGPVPGSVAGIIAGVHLGAGRYQQLAALQPALVRCVVQRDVAGRLDFVDVLAFPHQLQERCIQERKNSQYSRRMRTKCWTFPKHCQPDSVVKALLMLCRKKLLPVLHFHALVSILSAAMRYLAARSDADARACMRRFYRKTARFEIPF